MVFTIARYDRVSVVVPRLARHFQERTLLRSPNDNGILNAARGSPALVAIGTLGEVSVIWLERVDHSVYVGFYPDRRELYPAKTSLFFSRHIIPSAVTADDSQSATFFLTKSPFFSSSLEPDTRSLEANLLLRWALTTGCGTN